jgi:hypothetical protein
LVLLVPLLGRAGAVVARLGVPARLGGIAALLVLLVVLLLLVLVAAVAAVASLHLALLLPQVCGGGRRCRSIKLPVAGGREFNRAVRPPALGLTGAVLPGASECALAGASRCFTGRAAQPGTKRG